MQKFKKITQLFLEILHLEEQDNLTGQEYFG